ncbi:hypothetical protein QOT17_015538 [Balamuthia mandrillaris]
MKVVWFCLLGVVLLSSLPRGAAETREPQAGTGSLVSQEKVDVIYCVDGGYIEGLGASLHSILKHASRPQDLRFKILTSEEDMPYLQLWLETYLNQGEGDLPKIYHLDVQAFNRSLVQGKYLVHEAEDWRRLINDLNFARFYVYHHWPDLKKIVYVDADTIFTRDIAELYKKALLTDTAENRPHADASRFELDPLLQQRPGEPPVFAVFENCGARYQHYFEVDHPLIQKMFGSDCAFEAGVYVADIEEWQKQGITEKLERWMQANLEEKLYICGSQPPLMAVFYHTYENLKETVGWEHHISLGFPYRPTERPPDHEENKLIGNGVIEWNGDRKPWNPDGIWKKLWRPYRLPLEYSRFKARQQREEQRRLRKQKEEERSLSAAEILL